VCPLNMSLIPATALTFQWRCAGPSHVALVAARIHKSKGGDRWAGGHAGAGTSSLPGGKGQYRIAAGYKPQSQTQPSAPLLHTQHEVFRCCMLPCRRSTCRVILVSYIRCQQPLARASLELPWRCGALRSPTPWLQLHHGHSHGPLRTSRQAGACQLCICSADLFCQTPCPCCTLHYATLSLQLCRTLPGGHQHLPAAGALAPLGCHWLSA
jgi:hypothetical protein